jgi:hypothetical protein
MMLKSLKILMLVALWLSFSLVGCKPQGVRPLQAPRVQAQPSRLTYLDHQWLADKLAHKRAVSSQMLLDRFGEPKSKEESALGKDACWYYDCTDKEGRPAKLQVVVSSQGKVKRVRLY